MIRTGCLLDGKNGKVAGLFKETAYIVVADAETGSVLKEFARDGMSDEALARWVLEEDCEAIITGPMEQKPFEIVAEEGFITRYDGVGMTVTDAIGAMNRNRLSIIPDFIGGTGCHSGEGCREHHD